MPNFDIRTISKGLSKSLGIAGFDEELPGFVWDQKDKDSNGVS